MMNYYYLARKMLLGLICVQMSFTLVGKCALIEEVRVQKNKLEVIVNKEFKEKYLKDDFFVEYDADINLESLDYSLLIMPFIMNVISIIWISGNEYYVDSMDSKLHDSLERVKNVFKVLYPRTSWDGELKAHMYVDNEMPKKLDTDTHIALLYSGGLDSTTSSYFLADKKQLLITAWGQWDVPLDNAELWNTRKKQLTDFASEGGHENSFIRSNYSAFLNRDVLDELSPEIHSWRMETVEGIGWAGLAAPILFSKGYRVLYLASSESWDFQFPSAGTPYIDDNIRFSEIALKHHLFDYSRFKKIGWLVKEIKKKGKNSIFVKACLDRTPGNCCKCSRCYITTCGLLALGEDISIFGYTSKRRDIVELTKEYLVHHRYSCASDFVFNIQNIIDYLQEKHAQGVRIPDDLLWLLDFRLDESCINDIEGQKHIDWQALHELFPSIRDGKN